MAGGILTIDLAALTANWKLLAARAGEARCAAVVKADAYGLGMVPVARALWQAGCRTFFVALPHEGAALRAVLPDAVIFVLGGLQGGTAPFHREHGLRPVLSSLPEVAEWAAFCRRAERRLPAGLHVDTGMNRLGVTEDEARRVASDRDLLGACRLELVMSHLA
ncbi:MAG TPA: alanine racemase, partial [Thermopetrobacter sp.]|nr:alanine racemase [Thermopetrobacter sp.]